MFFSHQITIRLVEATRQWIEPVINLDSKIPKNFLIQKIKHTNPNYSKNAIKIRLDYYINSRHGKFIHLHGFNFRRVTPTHYRGFVFKKEGLKQQYQQYQNKRLPKRRVYRQKSKQKTQEKQFQGPLFDERDLKKQQVQPKKVPVYKSVEKVEQQNSEEQNVDKVEMPFQEDKDSQQLAAQLDENAQNIEEQQQPNQQQGLTLQAIKTLDEPTTMQYMSSQFDYLAQLCKNNTEVDAQTVDQRIFYCEQFLNQLKRLRQTQKIKVKRVIQRKHFAFLQKVRKEFYFIPRHKLSFDYFTTKLRLLAKLTYILLNKIIILSKIQHPRFKNIELTINFLLKEEDVIKTVLQHYASPTMRYCKSSFQRDLYQLKSIQYYQQQTLKSSEIILKPLMQYLYKGFKTLNGIAKRLQILRHPQTDPMIREMILQIHGNRQQMNVFNEFMLEDNDF